jgi:hypothetical protein
VLQESNSIIAPDDSDSDDRAVIIIETTIKSDSYDSH